MANKFIDLTDHKYGKLKVISFSGKNGSGISTWLCICECGNKITTLSSNLKNGNVRSCGCLRAENGRKTVVGISKKHGKSRTSIYRSWQNMKKRCYDIKNKDYYNYGANGVIVCNRWLKSFENFYEDMGDKPSPIHSIDRFPNKFGNYDPNNCRWATDKQQQNNKTNNKIVDYRGELMTVKQLSEKTGVKNKLLYYRLARGLSVENALIV